MGTLVGMDTREWFRTAHLGFLAVLDGLDALAPVWDADPDTPGAASAPGLGEWDLRALLGHTCRAYSTIRAYLTTEPTHLVLDSPGAYYAAARDHLADPAQVTRRGREAGAGLGEQPLVRARTIATEVDALVASSPDRAMVDTPVGGMRLIDYLPTRAFELTVHGLDLARAGGLQTPQALSAAAAPALHLAVSMADGPQTVALLLTLTGRESLPSGFCVL